MATRKVTKQSSARISRIGAKLLAKYKSMGVSGLEKGWYVLASDNVLWSDVAALAGSVVSQDETPRKVAKRWKR